MITLTEHAAGTIIAVRAQPGARKNAVTGEHAGALKVAVTAPPDKGRANDAIIEVLAEAFQIKTSQIELLSGATNRQKRFLLRDLTLQEVGSRLHARLEI